MDETLSGHDSTLATAARIARLERELETARGERDALLAQVRHLSVLKTPSSIDAHARWTWPDGSRFVLHTCRRQIGT